MKFLLRELSDDQRLWDVLVDPARKIRIGNKLYFGDDDNLVAEVIDNTTSRGRTLRFLYDGSYDEFRKALFDLGQTPLPKYIKREEEVLTERDIKQFLPNMKVLLLLLLLECIFQNIFLKRLEIKGINIAELTLHVGLGTFNPVEVEDLSKHKMDSEELFIEQKACDIINKAKSNKKRICAVGTTSMRGLESSVSSFNTLNPFNGWTHKFIFPPYDFRIADSMITNFHTPKSTLLMMASAFAGPDFIKSAYEVAIKEKYNFNSYGDAMLII